MTDKNIEPLNKKSYSFQEWLAKPKSIAICIFALFTLILCIVVFWSYLQYKNSGASLLSADKARSTSIANSIQKHNDEVLKVLVSYTKKTAFIEAAKKNDVNEARRQLALLKKDSDFNRAIITDKNGIVRSNFPVSPVGAVLAYRDWYKATSAKWEPNISGIFQVTIGDKPMAVAYSTPFFDEKRKPLGILTIYKKLDFLNDAAKLASIDQLTNLHVIDQTGNIVFDNKSDIQKKVTAYELFSVVQKAIAENRKQIEVQNQQQNKTISYLSIAKVEGTGWLAIVQRDLQGKLHPQQASIPTPAILIFVLLFITLSLGLIYFRKYVLLKNNKKQLPLETKLFVGKQIEAETQKLPENHDNQPNIPLIVWDHDLIIVRFDHTFEEMTGWSKEEVLGKKIDILFPENSKKDSLSRISSTAKSEKMEVLQVPILHSNGKTAIAHGHYIKDRKQDVTEISKLHGNLEKRVLERTANLEAANRQLEAFSYSISQALLTPLHTIEKLCDILKKSYSEKPDDAEKHHMEQLHKEVRLMNNLISDMLKLSRFNRAAISRQLVDVSKMVTAIMESCRQKYPNRSVSVTIDKDISINGDEVMLKIALENVIDNAWKFTASRERAVIKFGSSMKDEKMALFIRDNGVGFDMAHVNKLFSPFQRNEKSAYLPGIEPVTGIGLATVQLIVDRHGGEIWAEAKPGKGATFYFTLS